MHSHRQDIATFPLRIRVRVAQSLPLNPADWIRVEAGNYTPQRPVSAAPAQLRACG